MANNNKETERAELHKTIWRIANDLRGSDFGPFLARNPRTTRGSGHLCCGEAQMRVEKNQQLMPGGSSSTKACGRASNTSWTVAIRLILLYHEASR
jgi:hypothetical protein